MKKMQLIIFLPDSAVTCFAYLIQVNKADETKLMPLMESNQIEIPTKNIVIADGKDKRNLMNSEKNTLQRIKNWNRQKSN